MVRQGAGAPSHSYGWIGSFVISSSGMPCPPRPRLKSPVSMS